MTTHISDFAALLALSGLSQAEAADYLGVKIQSVKDMASGRSRTKDGIIGEMTDLIRAQEAAAQARSRGDATEPLPEGAEAAARGRYLVIQGCTRAHNMALYKGGGA